MLISQRKNKLLYFPSPLPNQSLELLKAENVTAFPGPCPLCKGAWKSHSNLGSLSNETWTAAPDQINHKPDLEVWKQHVSPPPLQIQPTRAGGSARDPNAQTPLSNTHLTLPRLCRAFTHPSPQLRTTSSWVGGIYFSVTFVSLILKDLFQCSSSMHWRHQKQQNRAIADIHQE